VRVNAPHPTLLFLPGTLCDSRVWQGVATQLADWPHVFVDYRAENRTTAMADKALASAAGTVIPIGLSMGGMVALEIWQRAPERVAALGLFDTNPDADTVERRQRRDAQLAHATEFGMASLAATQLIPSYRLTEHRHEQTVISMAADQTIEDFAAQCDALTHRTNMWPRLNQITVPTLIACGENDQLCPPEVHAHMASEVNHPSYHVIADAGHIASLDAPTIIADLLAGWLGELVL
jgi:pimeloyl-ACP methyl ester carboxylesterase